MRHMNLFRAVVLPALVVGIIGVWSAGPASAADASGCSGSAASYSDRGLALDQVEAPGAGGTQSAPFELTWNGHVDWQGQTDDVIQNGTWNVNLVNLPWLLKAPLKLAGYGDGLSGSIENDKGETTKSGSFVPSDKVPVMVPGTVEVDFRASSPDATPCFGRVWVKVVDDPTDTPLFWAALVLVLIAIILFALVGWLKWIGPIFSSTEP